MPTLAPAQSGDLRSARRSLDRERFADAYEEAVGLLSSRWSEEAREARLIVAEALIGMGRFSEAIRTLAPLLEGGPPAADDGPWVRLLARGLQGQGLLLEAADWWLTYAAFGRDERAESERNLERLLHGGLTQAELAYLFWKYPGRELLCEAVTSYGAAEYRLGHRREAARAYDLYRERCEDGRRRREERPVWAAARGDEDKAYDFYTVGVLAPVNGRFAQYGIELSNGADVARRLHNGRARFPLRLQIADTGGTPRGCLEAVARLYDAGVRIFVGEIFSLHTLMAASFLREREAVLLSPAATDTTVGLLGAGTYTCSVDAHEQMSAVIDFAADSLWVERIALLWPQTAQGRRWAELARRAAVTRRIEVAYDRAYPAGTTDFEELPESSAEQVPYAVDAIFCPGTLRELVSLLSQTAHMGFLGPFIGPPEMGDPVVADVVAEFGLTAIYPGGSFVSAPAARGAPRFEDSYRQLFGEEPGEFARRGWIAVEVLGNAIENGGYCPEALKEVLEASAAEALRRGEGRRLAVPREIGSAAVYLRFGDTVRLAGRYTEDEDSMAPPDSIATADSLTHERSAASPVGGPGPDARTAAGTTTPGSGSGTEPPR